MGACQSQQPNPNEPSIKFDYVIVGGGVCAGYACKQYVDLGLSKSNSLCVISSEDNLPYERPALSKGYLLNKDLDLPSFNTCAYEKQPNEMKYYTENNIVFKLSTTATSIDFNNNIITTNKEEEIGYNKLLLATGCSVIKFSNFLPKEKCSFSHIYYLRNIKDAKNIKNVIFNNEFKDKECVIIGGGYIGMEVAAAVASNGSFKQITMVFPEEHMMKSRGLFNKQIATKYHELYESNGIKFICNSSQILVESFDGDDNGNVKYVNLKNGEKIPAQVVIVGIGARANSNLFKNKLDIDQTTHGLTVDKNSLQSISYSNVFGCGDIISFPNKFCTSNMVRLEHVRHARSSAKFAMKSMSDNLNANEKKYGYEFLPVFYSRVFGQSWIFYGDIGAVVNADIKFGNNTKHEVKVYIKDISKDYNDDEKKEDDLLKDRQFILCAIWIDTFTQSIAGILLDSDDKNAINNVEQIVRNQKNIVEIDDFLKDYV